MLSVPLPSLLCHSLAKSLAWRFMQNPGSQGRGRKVSVPALRTGLGMEVGAETIKVNLELGETGQFNLSGLSCVEEANSKFKIVSSDTYPLHPSL